MINLDQKYLIIIKQILATHIPDKIVWAYGSRVKGNAHEGSDLDLVIISPNNSVTSATQLTALRAAFAESNLPILVDILDWSDIPKTFQQEIEKTYEIIQRPT